MGRGFALDIMNVKDLIRCGNTCCGSVLNGKIQYIISVWHNRISTVIMSSHVIPNINSYK